jgi:hypothetical protein
MTCAVCRLAPKREHGDTSGRVFDDMKRAPIEGARSLAALLIRNEIARLNLEMAQGNVKLGVGESGPGMRLAASGYYAQGEVAELKRIAEALESKLPEEPNA